MIVTEKVAANKWCPQARMVVTNEALNMTSINVIPPSPQNPQGQKMPCIASGCMEWEWEQYGVTQEEIEAGTAKGYCGLSIRRGDVVATGKPGKVKK